MIPFSNRLGRFLLVLLISLVSACAGSVVKKADSVASSANGSSAGGGNPYLTGDKPVPEAAMVVFGKAVESHRAGQLEAASELYRQVVNQYPDLSGAHLNLGLIAAQQGKADEAETCYKRAMAVNSNNLEAYNDLAILYRQQGRFSEAEDLWARALVLWPDYQPAHRNLGILYDLYMARPGEALKHYERYQSLQEVPDKMVNAWISDLKNRLNAGANKGNAVE